MANQQNQNTGQQAGSGKGKKQAKKENFEVQLVGTKNFKKSFRLYFDVILKDKEGKPKGNQAFKVMYQGENICEKKSNDQCNGEPKFKTDANGYLFFSKLFTYQEANKSVKLTFIGLDGFHATRTINFPLPEVKQEKKEEVHDINLLLVETEELKDKYKFTFRAFTTTAGKKPIGNVSFKAYHKKDLLIAPTAEKSCETGTNGEKEFQVEIEKSKLDKKLVIVVKADSLTGRTFTFDLPEEKKEEVTDINLLLVDTEDCGDEYNFTFRAFTTTVGKKPIGGITFWHYYRNKKSQNKTTDENGEGTFEKKIAKSELDKQLTLIVKAEGLTGKKFNFDLPEEKKRVIEKTNILSITNGESIYDLEKVTIPIHINMTFTGHRSDDYQIIILDSEMKLLSETPIEASADGRHIIYLEIPLGEVQKILQYEEGTKKIVVGLESKRGKEGEAKEDISEREHEVPVHLPAGTLKYAIVAFIIRQNKHLADLVKASILSFLMVVFVNYAGKGHFGAILTAFCAFLAWYTFAKSKSVIRKTVTFIWTALIITLAMLSFDGVVDLLTKGIVAAYVIGVPFYVAEELWRNPDGKQTINIYPWIPGYAFLGMAFWQFLQLPFEILDVTVAKESLKQAFLYLVTSSGLLIYGGSRELYDIAKSVGSDVAVTKLGGPAGIAGIIREGFFALRGIFSPGRRR